MSDPVETPKRLYRKAARGRDETTPVLVLSGVTMAIAVAVAVLIAIVLLVYLFV
jgi:hypothetical protein